MRSRKTAPATRLVVNDMSWLSKLVLGDSDDPDAVVAEAERVTRKAAADKKKREEEK